MLNSAVMLADEIMQMHYRIVTLEREVERLSAIERSYNELLDSSIRHGESMMGHLLRATLNGNLGAVRVEEAKCE